MTNNKRWLPIMLSAVIAMSGLPVTGASFNSFAQDVSTVETTDAAEETDSSPSISINLDSLDEGFTSVLYNNTNGLPTSEANAIATTSEGFIWIGCYSGLVRYDGVNFELLDYTNGITSVTELFVDSTDRLWIGTNDSGAAYMKNGKFTHFTKRDGLASLSIRSIIETDNGLIYLGTTNGVAYIDSNNNVKTIDDKRLNMSYVRELKLGCDGVIYGVTQDSTVFTIEDNVVTGFYTSDKLGVDSSRAILPDPDHAGYIYIADGDTYISYGKLNDDGLFIINKYDSAVCSFINELSMVDGKVWICGDNGVGFIKDGEINMIYNLPLSSSIEKMILDYQGNPWFVSSQQGVMKLVPDRFTSIYDIYCLDESVAYTTCMYNGMLFVGTKNNGLYILQDGYQIENMPIKESYSASGLELADYDLYELLRTSRVRSILRDSKNRLWFATQGNAGLVRFERSNILRFTVDDGMPSDKVRTIIELSDGSYLAVCTGGLVKIDNHDRITTIYNEYYGIKNTEFLTAAEAEDGTILAGTDGGGIYVIKGAAVRNIGINDGLPSEVILRIKKDHKRNIYWIITSNAIAYMDENYNIIKIEQFPYTNNYDLFQNSSDQMWILSSNGVYIVDTEDMLANGVINPVFYGTNNGLHCISTANSFSDLTENGDLYIAGTTGVSKVNIEESFENVSQLKAAVPYVKADGEVIYPSEDGTFRIPGGTKKLTIYPYVYTYSLINPTVSYSLEGFDKDKTVVRRDQLTSLDYTNLEGKTYYFNMDVYDTLSESDLNISVCIVKEKVFFETFSFNIAVLVLSLFLMLVVTYLIYKRRTAKLIKKNEEDKALIRGIVEAFAKVVDMKDKYTKGHSSRVAVFTSILAEELGYDEETVWKFYNIALMHDIGKIGVSDEVLNKPGKLTPEEYEEIKSHTTQGYEILKNITIMPELAIGAECHHERPDGKGYPRGLKGEEIPRVAQIIAVADTFDAMYSDRPYRKRMNYEKAVSIIREARGTQLTADVVDAFLKLAERGRFRDPNDKGGGTTEEITNIRNGKN
ncbi:MAG: HD domain-containing protein [Lachnospiraceae bacterium]|nr:HD domain-containing protein [Lachnospiraceae bacterium]